MRGKTTLSMLLGLFSAAYTMPVVAAPNSFCFRLFPVDVISCKDVRLTSLQDKVDQAYSTALSSTKGRRRQALIHEQESWTDNRAQSCGIPVIEWVTSQDVRRARPCLITLYQTRIDKLSTIQGFPLPTGGDEQDSGKSNSPGLDASTTATGAQQSADLHVRKRFWEEQAFYCKSGTDLSPAKNDSLFDPMRRYNPALKKEDWQADYISASTCDDGDMTFFNSLLCASGDQRGCNAVSIAQDKTGRWWRSKRLIGQLDTDQQASFSTEQGLGVLIYMVKTGDKPRFEKWLKWIADNPRLYGPSPSYCPHKECVFKLIDCPLLVTIASRFDLTARALSICSPLEYLHLPDPNQIEKQLKDALDGLLDVAKRYQDALNDAVNTVGKDLGLPSVSSLLPSPVDDLRKKSDFAFEAAKKAFEQLLGPQIAEAAARLAQELALINTIVDGLDPQGFGVNFDTGKITYKSGALKVEGADFSATGNMAYNPNGEHLAAVEVFVLRNLGYSSDVLDKAAVTAFSRDSNNPLFEYLAHDRSPAMLKIILDKCPSFERPSKKRFQWFPERGEDLQGDTKNTAWVESMYWDCLFLSHLYEEPVNSQLSRGSSPIDPFGGLVNPMGNVKKLLATWNDAKHQFENSLADARNKLNDALCAANPKCVAQKFCDANNDPACKAKSLLDDLNPL